MAFTSIGRVQYSTSITQISSSLLISYSISLLSSFSYFSLSALDAQLESLPKYWIISLRLTLIWKYQMWKLVPPLKMCFSTDSIFFSLAILLQVDFSCLSWFSQVVPSKVDATTIYFWLLVPWLVLNFSFCQSFPSATPVSCLVEAADNMVTGNHVWIPLWNEARSIFIQTVSHKITKNNEFHFESQILLTKFSQRRNDQLRQCYNVLIMTLHIIP